MVKQLGSNGTGEMKKKNAGRTKESGPESPPMHAKARTKGKNQQKDEHGLVWQARAEDGYLTHQRAVCHLGTLSCPTVGHGWAFPPDTPKIFVVAGLVPAIPPGYRPLRAGLGVIAPDDVTEVHLLPKVLFDAALSGQRPPPGQQRPRASPTGTVTRAWTALGRGAPETKSRLLLLTATVQTTVRAPGGRAAEPTASVF